MTSTRRENSGWQSGMGPTFVRGLIPAAGDVRFMAVRSRSAGLEARRTSANPLRGPWLPETSAPAGAGSSNGGPGHASAPVSIRSERILQIVDQMAGGKRSNCGGGRGL